MSTILPTSTVITTPQNSYPGFLEPVLKVTAYVILGVAAEIFFPTAAPVFFAVSISTVLSRIVVKIIDLRNKKLLDPLKDKAFASVSKYPVQITALVIAILVSFVLPILAVSIAVLFGILNGLVLGRERGSQNQSTTSPTLPQSPSLEENSTIVV